MSETVLAGTESETFPVLNLFAGDQPAPAFENGTLITGQDLPARAVIGRITASGKLTRAVASASDGSQIPVGILVHATTATADTPVQYYKAGNFFADALNWDATFTAVKQAAAFDGTAIVLRF
jgi:hypothetical protein